MNCQDFQLLLNRDLDGILDASESARLSGHLAACARCASEHASLQAVHNAFRDLRQVEIPAGLAETIAARAAAPRESVLRFPRHFLIPAAAAVLALCLVSGSVGFRIRETSSVQAAPDRDRKDEASYRAFLADQLGLSEDRIASILEVQRETTRKLSGVDAESKEKRERLLRNEIDAIWKLLPDATRRDHPELDPSQSAHPSGSGSR